MDSTTQQDQLDIVSALAASLADRMLMERLTSGTLPLSNANRLWTASLLLEEHQCPVPGIVEDVLAQFRNVEPGDGRDVTDPDSASSHEDPAPQEQGDEPAPRKGRLIRLLRPFRQAADS
jgi:hypothetical protein